jgi:hypothetical protein
MVLVCVHGKGYRIGAGLSPAQMARVPIRH